MKTKTNKAIQILTIVMITLILSTAMLNANYAKPEMKIDDTLTVNIDTREQTFDQALLIGLQLLDQACENHGNGQIIIDNNGDKYTAVVSLKALKDYDASKEDYASFIKNNVKFI